MTKCTLLRRLSAAALLVCTSAAMAQPANDTCAGAIVINPAALPFNSGAINWSTATTDTDNNPSCDSSSNTLGAKFGVWFSFTPTVTGTYNIAQTASQDTATSIWTGPCGPGQVQFSCSDPESSSPTLTAGTTYFILISKWNTSAATGTVTFTLTVPPAPPANDLCSNAITVTPGTAVTANNAAATSTNDGPAATCQASSGKGIWYKYTPASTGSFSVSSCGSPQDTVLQVFTTPDCVTFTAVACDDDTCAGGETGLCGSGVGNSFASLISSVTLTGGTTYYFRLSSFGGTPTGGCLSFLLTQLTTPGACCNNTTGACTVVQQSACGAGSTYQGDGSTCPNTNCPASGSCCVGQCCTVVTAASCTSVGGTFTSGGTCATGSCTTPLANDVCTDALPVFVGTPIIGCNTGATLSTGEIAPSCQSSYGASVWYALLPTTTGFYDISLCGSNFDTVLSVFSGVNCASATAIACDDDACVGGEPGALPGTTGNGLASVITALQLTAGQQYYVRVAGFGTATGAFRLLVSTNTVAGACCNATTGACTVSATGSAGCASGTTFVGGVCSPNPCPQPSGACCTPDGLCSVILGTDCVTAGGVFQGPATTCGAGNACPVSVGSCCNNTTGACSYIVATATCSGGTFTAGGVCSPNACPQPGACCISGCCTVTLQANCTGTWGPANSTCTAGICGALVNDTCAGAITASVGANPGSNCGANTDFAVTPTTLCGTTSGAGGARDVWHKFTPTQSANYTLSTCDAIGFDSTLALYGSCPADGTVPPIACNDDTAGTCSFSTLRSEIPNQLLLAGQTYYIRVAAWSGGTAEGPYVLSITQGAAAGACCSGSTCTIVLGFNCSSGYQGDFTTCSPNPCDPSGSCCAADGSCTTVSQSACTGTFTAGGTCTPNTCPQPTGRCCVGARCAIVLPAACTATGTAGFNFTAGASNCNATGVYNSPCCFADYNKAGGVGVQDIFDFLADWFSGSVNANVEGDGIAAPGVQDIFDFLAAWFAGCA